MSRQARSLNDAAVSSVVVAAGAARHSTGVIEVFSSRGPTIDGRIKPDLTGPDGVSGATYGPSSFFGTSASAPYVAGAAALILDAAPCLSAGAVHSLLVELTEDRGTAGTDNTYGAGLLRLGSSSTVAANFGCVLRYAGSDRYATAAIVSQEDFTAGANTVFISTGQNFPDALAGAAVAGKLGAPILLVRSDSIPGVTASEPHDSTRIPSLYSAACQQSPWSRHRTRRVRNSHPALWFRSLRHRGGDKPIRIPWWSHRRRRRHR